MAKRQMISCSLLLDVTKGGKPVTEAAFKRWLSAKLKNCELGTLSIGDPVEFSEDLIAKVLQHREDRDASKA